MSLQAAIMTGVSRAQRGLKIEAGARFIRGRRIVTVVDAGEDGITWRDDVTDVETTDRLAVFAGLALRRLRGAPDPDEAPASLLAVAWDLASTTTIPPRERYALLVELYASVFTGATGTAEERAALMAWATSLLHGAEPEPVA